MFVAMFSEVNEVQPLPAGNGREFDFLFQPIMDALCDSRITMEISRSAPQTGPLYF